MNRKIHYLLAFLAFTCAFAYLVSAKVGVKHKPTSAAAATLSATVAAPLKSVTQGALQVVSSEGNVSACPLKHTDVKAEISGFLSRVTVTQEFENPFKDKIEAVYTFPLSANAAVDEMTMRVGERTVRGQIRKREEARAIYEAARAAGNVASLLDQERPNIFTQSVANIMPGDKVTITISYVETLKYEDGAYEFVFPMVVGPRYIPGEATGKQGTGRDSDTDLVPDASRITPGVASAGTRAGHDIAIEVQIDAGVPIETIQSTLHEVETATLAAHSSLVRLKNRNEIPNKDFILRYDVAGGKIEDALLTHRGQQGGFFTLILQPPDRVTAADVTPKEIVFVLDTSGSMMGFPIEKAKECMKLALDNLYPQDTFNLITFSGDTHILFQTPMPATAENLRKAQQFLASRQGSGGTEMMKAIRAALAPSDKQNHIRIVCFMTDGYVGNDMGIIAEVKKYANARVFSFGIGSSVNRFLLDKMAEHGRGEVEYLTLNGDGAAAARRLHERIRNPLLTDITVDWAGLPVADVYPKRIPDLFSAKPVVLTGRYTAAGRGKLLLKGKLAGRDFVKEIAVNLPEAEARRDVLAKLWARTRIEDLMAADYAGAQYSAMDAGLQQTITQLGLEYRLMTQFTSFVAVEEMVVTEGGQPRRIEVPVEIPEGVSREGALGEPFKAGKVESLPVNGRAYQQGAFYPSSPVIETVSVSGAPKDRSRKQEGKGVGAGSGGGIGAGSGAGVGNGSASVNRPGVTNKPDVAPTDAERRNDRVKLHPMIAALVERLKNKAQPSADEAKFVRDNKAELQVWLTDKSPQIIEQLKQLGFEVIAEPKSARLVIGRIAIDKLEALAALEVVTYLSPLVGR